MCFKLKSFLVCFLFLLCYLLRAQSYFQITGNDLSIQGLITPDTKKHEWPEMRERIKDRIFSTFGEFPEQLVSKKTQFKELKKYKKYGFTHILYRYHVLSDQWDEGILVLPQKMTEGKAAAVVIIHGTADIGKEHVLDLENRIRRAYGIELAQRGYITFSPDQYGFGKSLEGRSREEVMDAFYQKYPGWSMLGRQLLGLVRALDVLDQLDFVDHKTGYGTIGNSLGGRSVLYLAAMDERIKAAVSSTGVSPFVTNVYRKLNWGRKSLPYLWKEIGETGKPQWDMHELIALTAPRAILFLEPFNDPYNPYTITTIHAIYSAHYIWKLLERPELINMVIHGDGHDTRHNIRQYAYEWFDRFLLGIDRDKKTE